MSHRKSKRIRKQLFGEGISISAVPYRKENGVIYASNRRQMYQRMKKGISI